MASLRDIRKRIRSVQSTQKITSAMKMVAAARLRRAQDRVQQSMPYAEKIEELLRELASSASSDLHPLLQVRPVNKRLLVVFTSDRGLCGAYNANILRRADKELREDSNLSLLTVGRKAITYFNRRKGNVAESMSDYWKQFSYESASALAKSLAEKFVTEQFDQVDVLFSKFVSVMTQRAELMTLVPIPRRSEEQTEQVDQIFEPDREGIVKELVPRAVDIRLYVASLNALASELGARMTAMDSATRNSEEMIDRLTLDMNRARQSAITTELMEIIGGAEALK